MPRRPTTRRRRAAACHCHGRGFEETHQFPALVIGSVTGWGAMALHGPCQYRDSVALYSTPNQERSVLLLFLSLSPCCPVVRCAKKVPTRISVPCSIASFALLGRLALRRAMFSNVVMIVYRTRHAPERSAVIRRYREVRQSLHCMLRAVQRGSQSAEKRNKGSLRSIFRPYGRL